MLTHPNVNIEWVSSRTYSDQEYSDVYKSYFTLLDQKCVDEDIEKYLDHVDVVFFATPQGVCAKMVNENVLKKVKVIDLSADYRIKDVETYESWYGIKHASPEFKKQFMDYVKLIGKMLKRHVWLLILDVIQHVPFYRFIHLQKQDLLIWIH